MNKNTLIGLVIVLVVVIIGIIGLSYYGSNHAINTPADTGTTTTTVTTRNPGPTPVPPTTTGIVGYIGCSNTWKTVEGYHDQAGGTNMWEADSVYGGGDAEAWGRDLTNRNPYWAEFDKLSAEHSGTKTLWYQICAKKGLTYNQTYTYALAVINEAKKRIPGVTIYVSGLNGFNPVDLCNISGPTGGTYSDQASDALVANGLALKGPVLATLSRDQTTDGCHPNDAGKVIVGGQLKAFFH